MEFGDVVVAKDKGEVEKRGGMVLQHLVKRVAAPAKM